MSSAEQLQKLFKYDSWANNKVLRALEVHTSFEDRGQAANFLTHIIGSQHRWYHRITGTELPDTDIWPDFLLADCQALIEANYQRWSELITNRQDALQATLIYQNSKGQQHQSQLADVLHHLIIHGQHHRSQIALLMRQADVAPPATDFIFFTRQAENR